MLNKINEVIKELQSTNSATDKLNILSKYKNDISICNFFKYAYNPFVKFGVTSKNLQKNNKLSELEFFKDIFELCDKLSNRVYTGNKAIAMVNGFINQNNLYDELLYNFFDRNLKIGMNVKQINKALNNIIPVFDVALASIYEESKAEKYGLDNYIIQTKINGVRLVTIITYNSETKTAEAKSYSRTGKEFTTCKRIEDELLEYYNKSKYFGQNVVFDGEACIVDKDGKDDWNAIVSEIKRKDYIMEHPKYIIFDFMSLDEFTGVTESRNYSFRRDTMFKNFFGLDAEKFKYLQIIFATPYSFEKYCKLINTYVKTDKWEGLILRKDTAYKSGRSTDLLKVKLFKDAEYIVKGFDVTTKPMLKDEKMVETKCVGALKIELENGAICGVGSGMSDAQRIEWLEDPSKIVGKMIQVKYKELTKNADGSWSLQFPVITHIFDEERDF
jgi:DNA ligase-1